MPRFVPPTQRQGTNDRFWGRFGMDVGISVLLRNGHYQRWPVPSSDDLTGVEGVDFFRGGYKYMIDPTIGQSLIDDGFDVDMNAGYGYGGYGDEGYGN